MRGNRDRRGGTSPGRSPCHIIGGTDGVVKRARIILSGRPGDEDVPRRLSSVLSAVVGPGRMTTAPSGGGPVPARSAWSMRHCRRRSAVSLSPATAGSAMASSDSRAGIRTSGNVRITEILRHRSLTGEIPLSDESGKIRVIGALSELSVMQGPQARVRVRRKTDTRDGRSPSPPDRVEVGNRTLTMSRGSIAAMRDAGRVAGTDGDGSVIVRFPNLKPAGFQPWMLRRARAAPRPGR